MTSTRKLWNQHFHPKCQHRRRVAGTQVLNYAVWIDEKSHRETLERSARGAVGSEFKMAGS